MDNFIAIDVETANQHPSSICAIGAVKVKNGLVVDQKYTLVKPEPEFFASFCIQVHGIVYSDVEYAPVFGDVWKEWHDWFEGLPFVAHNAAFDSKCIQAACKIYMLDPPEDQEFYCTLKAARRRIPRGMLPSKSLDSLCDFFGVPLKNHHCALDDAFACARLAVFLIE